MTIKDILLSKLKKEQDSTVKNMDQAEANIKSRDFGNISTDMLFRISRNISWGFPNISIF